MIGQIRASDDVGRGNAYFAFALSAYRCAWYITFDNLGKSIGRIIEFQSRFFGQRRYAVKQPVLVVRKYRFVLRALFYARQKATVVVNEIYFALGRRAEHTFQSRKQSRRLRVFQHKAAFRLAAVVSLDQLSRRVVAENFLHRRIDARYGARHASAFKAHLVSRLVANYKLVVLLCHDKPHAVNVKIFRAVANRLKNMPHARAVGIYFVVAAVGHVLLNVKLETFSHIRVEKIAVVFTVFQSELRIEA